MPALPFPLPTIPTTVPTEAYLVLSLMPEPAVFEEGVARILDAIVL